MQREILLKYDSRHDLLLYTYVPTLREIEGWSIFRISAEYLSSSSFSSLVAKPLNATGNFLGHDSGHAHLADTSLLTDNDASIVAHEICNDN